MATKARASSEGLGPLQREDLYTAFKETCGYLPEGESLTLLQRMPGLGIHGDGETRVFLDRDFVEAAKAGDEARLLHEPYKFNRSDSKQWRTTLRKLGREILAVLCKQYNITGKTLSSAIQAAHNDDLQFLCSDLMQVAAELEYNYEGKAIKIIDVDIHDALINDSGQDFSKVTYKDCVFHRIEFPAEIDAKRMPSFQGCLFGIVEGRSSQRDLEAICNPDCMFEDFVVKPETTASILQSSLPTGARVLLTVLEKIYLQSGSGRKEKALRGGLDQRSREILPEILDLARKNNLAISSSSRDQVVWLPVREARARSLRILKMTSVSQDEILREAAEIR